ncbi:hypothetical protein AVEN_100069-1 [Araneus ventricosus]|uniref:Uncharacterized protein n=1 Tax=Araneus ventricosus TaxID=182803 RepID=A0A4Y2LSX6_ARAVE|nr:hypothetical protein AVEN_100069-1 [Araneus ventricosus]
MILKVITNPHIRKKGIILERAVEIWSRAPIPTLQHKGLNVTMKTYLPKCQNLLKSHLKAPKKGFEEFHRTRKVWFEIASCKCKNIDECFRPRHKKYIQIVKLPNRRTNHL